MADNYLVLDAHCDAPSQMLRLRDYGQDNTHAQVDFPKMKRGGIDASFFALYIPAALSGKPASDYAFRLMAELERQIAANPDMAAMARSAAEVHANRARGLVSVIPCMENSSALNGSFGLLAEFVERGVRYVTLTHSSDNEAGDSCTGSSTWGGLSRFGSMLVREMNRLGTLVDVAHASDATIRDVLRVTDSPVVCTHTCCRKLSRHPRNLPDSLIRDIAHIGGVIGISIYPVFLSEAFCHTLSSSGLLERTGVEEAFIKNPSDPAARAAWFALKDELQALPRPGVKRVVDHIEHAVNLAGIDHVGIGTDYDGIEVTASGLETVETLDLVFEEMRRRGFGVADIAKVAGGNYLRLL